MSPGEPTRAIIADDEPLARSLLHRMLAARDDVVVVGEAGTGEEALALVRDLRPDLLFVDVQMPGMSGPDLVRAVGPEGPAVIFVTAYDSYAVEAFELHALDYLLKPFDEERLSEALRRARGRRASAADVVAAVTELARIRAHSGAGRIYLTEGGRTVIRRLSDIDWVEADRKMLRVHSAGRTYTVPGPLMALEQRLDPTSFARISRSMIANLDRVAEIQPWFGGELVLVMADGARLTTSRGYRSRLDAIFGRVPRRDQAP